MHPGPSRSFWASCLAGTIALGLASRTYSIGWVVWDKYLGDALYAVMVYAILRMGGNASPRTLALLTLILMTAIELFQLTGIPRQLLASGNAALRIVARLLGTTFSFMDLGAYIAGIAAIRWLDDYRQGFNRPETKAR